MDPDLSFACVGFKRNRVKMCCMAATRRVGRTTRRVRSRVPSSSVPSVSSGRGELGSGLSELRVDSVMEGLGEFVHTTRRVQGNLLEDQEQLVESVHLTRRVG